MARLLALDWDEQEVRYVVANTQGTQLVLEAAARVALFDNPDGDNPPWGATLQSALASHKVGRAVALVGVERSQIELLSLTLPPATDAELPEMVRHQAMRESNAITEESVLDFVPLNEDPTEMRKVTAVALSSERLGQIQTICADAGVTPQAIVLRPYAAAALFLGTTSLREQASLLINVVGEAIDLSVVSRGKVVFWRTLRQADVSHDPASSKKLIAELNRTLVVAQDLLDNQPIAAAYLFGGLEEHPALVEQLRDEFPLSVTLVDPFASLAETPRELPDGPGRFSSLLGMLTLEARHGSQAIDFLHPRKQPKPPDRRRTLILAAAAAALLLFLGGYHVWSTFAEIDARNAGLSEERDELVAKVKSAGKQQKTIQAIQDWVDHDVNWLDELRDLSLRFPSGRDAVVNRMTLSHGHGFGGAGGTIIMVGVVRDPVIVSRMESNLRDKYHEISSPHVQERVQDKSYSWHFESSLIVTPRDKKQYVSHLPEPPEDSEPSDKGSRPASSKPTPPRPPANPR